MAEKTEPWLIRARAARERLASAKRGEREAVLHQLAGRHEVNSVRRLVQASILHDRWTQSGRIESGRLLQAPRTVLEAFARWAEFDDENAWRGFLEWERERLTVQALNAKVAARRQAAGLADARTLERQYRDRFEGRILEVVKDQVGRNAVFKGGKSRRGFGMPPVDYEWFATGAHGEGFDALAVAVIIVGPYRGRSMYGRKLVEWMQRALSLAWLYGLVLLVVPDLDEAREYQAWLEAFCRNPAHAPHLKPNVRVVGLS